MEPAPSITIYQTDIAGRYCGPVTGWLIKPTLPQPGQFPEYTLGVGTVYPKPPDLKAGYVLRYVSPSEYNTPLYRTDGTWVQEPIPVEAPEEVMPSEEATGK